MDSGRTDSIPMPTEPPSKELMARADFYLTRDSLEKYIALSQDEKLDEVLAIQQVVEELDPWWAPGNQINKYKRGLKEAGRDRLPYLDDIHIQKLHHRL